MPKKKKEMPKEEECCCGSEEESCCGNHEHECCEEHMHDCCGGHNHFPRNFHHGHKPCGGIYGLGFIGAAIFFIGQASTFWQGVLGLLKAIIWPVFMVLELFKFLIK